MFPARWSRSAWRNIDVNAVASHPWPTTPHKLSTSHGWNAHSSMAFCGTSSAPCWTSTYTSTFAAINPTVTSGKRRVGTLSRIGITGRGLCVGTTCGAEPEADRDRQLLLGARDDRVQRDGRVVLSRVRPGDALPDLDLSAVREQPEAADGVGDHQHEHRVLRAQCGARAAEDRDRAVVRDHEPEHVARHERRHLDVPDLVGLDRRQVRLEARGAEEIPAEAEGV